MSQKAPISHSGRPVAQRQGRPRAGFTLVQIIAVVAAAATGAFAILVKNPDAMAAGAVLVGAVAGLGALLVFGRGEEPTEAAPAKDDAVGNLARTLEANRAEYNAKIAELKRSLEAAKAQRSATDSDVLREELGKIRAELVGLRGQTGRR